MVVSRLNILNDYATRLPNQEAAAIDDWGRAASASATCAMQLASPDQTATYYRQRLQESPERWHDALKLREALLAGNHYPDADPVFRASIRHMPDHAWLAHYRNLTLFHPTDLALLRSRAERLLPIHAEPAVIHGLLGRIAAQQKDYAIAAHHFAHSNATDRQEQAATLLRYHCFATLMDNAPASGPAYAVAVINLDQNPGRLSSIKRSFSQCPVAMHRIPGVLGSSLSNATVQALSGDPEMRGTLGCFLSHVGTWKWMLAQRLPNCLIVEDDVMSLLSLPFNLGPFNLPNAYDICFVNDRLQPSFPHSEVMGCIPLQQALRGFAAEANAPGADGYILSESGARKLLAWVKADGCADDVDWRILAYSVSAQACAALPRPSFLWDRMDLLHRRVFRNDRLDAWVLDPALVRTIGLTSDRENENRLQRSSAQ